MKKSKGIIMGLVFCALTFGLLLMLWPGLEVRSCLTGMALMGLNILLWQRLYLKISQQQEQMVLWVSFMGCKFLLIGVLVYALPQLLSLEHLSFGLGIFIVAFSGVCASVGLAKNHQGAR